MKILLAGEASVHLTRYCTAIRQYVDDLVVVTETPVEIPEARRVYTVGFRSRNPVQWWGGLRALRKILEEEQPDVVHVHQVNRLAFFTCVANDGRRPFLATAWGSDVLLVPERNALYRYFTTYVLRKSRFVTADAHVMIDAMQRLVPSADRYVWLQYGIEPVRPAGKEKIIYSNRLHRPLYNIATIVQDFAAFSRKHPDYTLCIGGSGPDTDSLKQLCETLGIASKVTFTGWRNAEENAALYAKSEVYISIPSSDGTSVSLLEAMSAGCIPVVSDLPVTREWITDGINGVVRRDATALDRALALDHDACRRINQEKTAGLSRKEMTIRFLELYQKALQR